MGSDRSRDAQPHSWRAGNAGHGAGRGGDSVTTAGSPPWRPVYPRAVAALDSAHSRGVAAAVAGMTDPALGAGRLAGAGVPILAEAAVTSATPYLRAPLLAR